MGGTLAYADTRCALGTLSDAQPYRTAGPYTLRGADAPSELFAVGQVTLYNRAELLDKLARHTQPPPPDCTDGELLLRYYAHAGIEGFAHVSGMFACAIRDGDNLLLVRDAAGTRTLFYSQQGEYWAATSALRALRRWPRLSARINLSALRSYLTFAYLPGEETLLDSVHELLPGHCLRIGPQGSAELLPYWHLREQAWKPDEPPESYIAHLRHLCEEAVHAALPPDEPVAVFLSGGLDSSLVAALAARLHNQPVTTYAINFGSAHTNELAYAELVANFCGTRHHVLTFSGEQVLAHLAETMARLDTPVGDPLTAPNLLMSRHAAADGFRTILNGEGGDPCFGGPKNLPMLLFELYRTDPAPLDRARAYLRAYRNCYDDLPALLSPDVQHELRNAPPVERLVQPYLESPDMRYYLNRLMLANVRTKGAHHILTKVEGLTSSCGLEAHAPLFHRAIVEYSFAIPPHLKLSGITEKWVLKQAVRDILPPLIVQRPKSGMRMPLPYWLDGPLGRAIDDVLLSQRALARGLFRAETIRAWQRGDDTLWPRHANKLWLLLSLELWLRAYLDDDCPNL
jgi:asparagine synthase (glutamine-hydrolysing)